jgi:hypothetical protein
MLKYTRRNHPMPASTRTRWAIAGGAAALAVAVWLLPSPALSHERVKTSVTYDREISRILMRRCIACHTDGSLAMPLTTYEETRPWARAIEEEVLSRHMPPWRAVPGYGAFVNDGALTTREQQTVLAWIEGNGPKTPEQLLIVNIDQGTTAADEQLRPDFDRWLLGQPQLVRPVHAAAPPAAGAGGLQVVRTTVDLALDGERRIGGLEFRPHDRRGLRAATFSVDGTGQWLATWTPWHTGVTLPADASYRLPRDARIVADLYYQAGSTPRPAAGDLGLSFRNDTAARCAADLLLRADGDVPAGAARQKFRATSTIAADTMVLALAPELRDGARTLEVRARKPDGSVQVLLLVRDMLHDWPTPYIFAAPMPLPRGTELSAIASYENTTAAPRPGGVAVRVSVANGC